MILRAPKLRERGRHTSPPPSLFSVWLGSSPALSAWAAERGQVQATPLPQPPGFPLARHLLQESEARLPPLGGGGGGRDKGAAQACQVAREAAAEKVGGGLFWPENG